MAYKKPIPTLRNNPIAKVIGALGSIQLITAVNYPYRNCLNCINWNVDKDSCGKFNSKPPPEILVYSCESYEDFEEAIPF